MISSIVLLLFIINLGIAFGAGLYEARIVLPMWFTRRDGQYAIDHQAMQQTDVGRKFWAFVTTVPLTLLTLANLFLAFNAGTTPHGLWLAAACIAFVERVATFTFFIPTAIRFQRSDEKPVPNVSRLIERWQGFNYVRNALTLAAWIVALLAR